MIDFEHIHLDRENFKWKVDDYTGVGWDVVDANGVSIAYHIEEEDEARLIAYAPDMKLYLILAMAKLRDGGVDAKRLADEIETLLDKIDGEE